MVVGITWIGLLYYFNFVQVPAFAEMEAAARNNAIDKLASRALWWFRWAAVATVVSGLLILGFQKQLDDMDYFKAPQGIAIATGILLALTMFVNVWGIIWRNQKIVIANARNVQAGGEARPERRRRRTSRVPRVTDEHDLLASDARVHGRHLALPVRHRSEFPRAVTARSARPTGRSCVVIWLVLELNAIGVIGGRKPGGTNVIYDTHKAALITGFLYCGGRDRRICGGSRALGTPVRAISAAHVRDSESNAFERGGRGRRPAAHCPETPIPVHCLLRCWHATADWSSSNWWTTRWSTD